MIAKEVASRMEYLNESVELAASAVINRMSNVGGEAGVIALDKYGNCK